MCTGLLLQTDENITHLSETKASIPVPGAPSSPSFSEIYAAHAGRILNFIFHLVQNEEAARDLTQEVFIKVFENLAGFREQSQVYTWIHRIALNHTLNFLKSEKRRKLRTLLEMDFVDLFREKESEPKALAAPSSEAPDELLERRDRQQIVQAALASLPASHRIPFLLYRYEEMSHQEIANALGISLSAVETRIHRAKKLLIKKLEPWLEDL
ncbi:MAG TPA: RNA polymerase subunit sigma-24 [Bacteroidetes bacterium]|nr:RNA polymerase subunit sigma-24 [Bacteroidota bacterium]